MILNLKTDRKDLKTFSNCFSVEKQLGEFILVYSICLFEESNCAILLLNIEIIKEYFKVLRDRFDV